MKKVEVWAEMPKIYEMLDSSREIYLEEKKNFKSITTEIEPESPSGDYTINTEIFSFKYKNFNREISYNIAVKDKESQLYCLFKKLEKWQEETEKINQLLKKESNYQRKELIVLEKIKEKIEDNINSMQEELKELKSKWYVRFFQWFLGD